MAGRSSTGARQRRRPRRPDQVHRESGRGLHPSAPRHGGAAPGTVRPDRRRPGRPGALGVGDRLLAAMLDGAGPAAARAAKLRRGTLPPFEVGRLSRRRRESKHLPRVGLRAQRASARHEHPRRPAYWVLNDHFNSLHSRMNISLPILMASPWTPALLFFLQQRFLWS